MHDIIGPRGRFLITCRTRDGRIKWEKDFPNTVVNAGKKDLLDKYFQGAGYTAAWYVGLKGEGTIAAADTASSHAGWSEFTSYSETTRPLYDPAAATISTPNATITNSASPATFTFSGTGTVGGLFLISNSTKGGTGGLLFAAGNFPGGAEDVTGTDIWNARYSFMA